MTDLPDLSDPVAALRWARDVLLHQEDWRHVVSGRAIIAMARRIVQESQGSVRMKRAGTRP